MKNSTGWSAAISLATAIAIIAVSAEAQSMGTPRVEPLSSEIDATVLGAKLLSRWAPVAESAGFDLQTWREQFFTQFALMPLVSLQLMDRVQPNVERSAKANYEAFARSFRSALMTWHVRSESDKTMAKLGSASSDQVFVPITPCRVVDTRLVGGPLSAGAARNFLYYTDGGSFDWASQGGPSGQSTTTCPFTIFPTVGKSPSAAVATITVVGPTAAGNFVAWGGANPVPTTSVLNWNKAGDIAANTTVIPGGGRAGTGPGGTVRDFAVFYNGPTGAGQIVVDVVGYFIENKATALDCTDVTSDAVAVPAGSSNSAIAPACPTGYTRTATECIGSIATVTFAQFDGACSFRNTGGTSTLAGAIGRCCRVPGI